MHVTTDDGDLERWRWHDHAWPQVTDPGVRPVRETSFGDPDLGPDLCVEVLPDR